MMELAAATQAWGTGGPEFKSRRSDHNIKHLDEISDRRSSQEIELGKPMGRQKAALGFKMAEESRKPIPLSRDSRAAQRIEVPDHVGDSSFGCPSVGQPAESCLDLRNAFWGSIGLYGDWARGQPEPKATLDREPITISMVCDLVENFVEPMPDLFWQLLSRVPGRFDRMPEDRSFRSGAKFLAKLIRERKEQFARPEPGTGSCRKGR
jgi:hypothetical protein